MKDFDENEDGDLEKDVEPKMDDLEDPEAGFDEADMFGDSSEKDSW